MQQCRPTPAIEPETPGETSVGVRVCPSSIAVVVTHFVTQSPGLAMRAAPAVPRKDATSVQVSQRARRRRRDHSPDQPVPDLRSPVLRLELPPLARSVGYLAAAGSGSAASAA